MPPLEIKLPNADQVTSLLTKLSTLEAKIVKQELRPDKNLFNKDTGIADYSISSSGELSPSVGWFTSDFIPVISNSDITANKMRFLAEYDENKQLIKHIDSGSPTEIETTLTTTENTAYIRITINVSTVDILQVEYGTVSTVYEPYSTTLYIGDKKYHEVHIVDTVDVKLSGSIPEYGWLSIDDEPTPDDPTKMAFGIVIDVSTDTMSTKYWNGSLWKELI